MKTMDTALKDNNAAIVPSKNGVMYALSEDMGKTPTQADHNVAKQLAKLICVNLAR